MLQAEERLQQLRFNPSDVVDPETLFDLTMMATGDVALAGEAKSRKASQMAGKAQS
jgi:hypothetical protein